MIVPSAARPAPVGRGENQGCVEIGFRRRLLRIHPAAALVSRFIADTIAQPTDWTNWVARLPEIEKQPRSREAYTAASWRGDRDRPSSFRLSVAEPRPRWDAFVLDEMTTHYRPLPSKKTALQLLRQMCEHKRLAMAFGGL